MNSGDSITRSVVVLAGEQPASAASGNTKPATTVTTGHHSQLVKLQWFVGGALCLVLVLPMVRLGFVSGLVRTVRIEGPSMAPALCGAHYQVTCDDCGMRFACDAEHTPSNRQVTCPNCGYQLNDLEDADLRAGERVLIDRWPLLFRRPQRHEVVAARDPTTPGDLVVKRIAALPRERLEVRGGDLYVGGRIVRKSLAELREVRVLVHDNDFQPQKTRGLPTRWASDDAVGWQRAGNAFRFDHRPLASGGVAGNWKWLHYHHWRCVAGPGSRTTASSVLDNDSYNQAESRELNHVPDVLLSCELSFRRAGEIALVVKHKPWHRYVVYLNAGGKEAVLTEHVGPEEKELIRQALPANLAAGPVVVEFGLCDRQVLLAVDRRTIIAHSFDDTHSKPPPEWHRAAMTRLPGDVVDPIQIGVRDASLEVSHLRIWRDIYYLDPVALPRPWRADSPLSSGQYALLGDNVPVSLDSRNWPQPGVPRGHILGRVYRPFWASPSLP